LRRLCEWALTLERDGAAELTTYHGKARSLLLVHVPGEGAGFVTIWNERGGTLQVWRTVFQRLAPDAVANIPNASATSHAGRRLHGRLTNAARIAISTSATTAAQAAESVTFSTISVVRVTSPRTS